MNKTKLILGALVALAASSCTMEDDFQDQQLKEQELTITATREGDETLTRTYRDDSNMSIWWIPGDFGASTYAEILSYLHKQTAAGIL